jgi:hypothetical protein
MDGKTAGRREAVHIYQNLTTQVAYTFTDADFTAPLPTIAINWNDVSPSPSNHNSLITGTDSAYWYNESTANLTATIDNGPANPQVRWSITTDPLGIAAFDGYTDGTSVPAATSVSIKPPTGGFNHATAGNTAIITVTLDGYPGVEASFILVPGPYIQPYYITAFVTPNITWTEAGSSVSFGGAYTFASSAALVFKTDIQRCPPDLNPLSTITWDRVNPANPATKNRPAALTNIVGSSDWKFYAKPTNSAVINVSNVGINDRGGFPVTLTILAATNVKAPVITTQPSNTGSPYVLNAAATALSVTANGTTGTGDLSGTLTYQWYKNTSNSTTDATAISSATGAAYTPPTTALGTLYYYVKVTSANAAATGTTEKTVDSTIVAVTVINQSQGSVTVTFGGLPQDESTTLGGITNNGALPWASPLTLTVPTTNLTGATYQWYKDGVVISGASANSVTIAAKTFSLTEHQVMVRIAMPGNGPVYSKTVTFTVQ